MSVTVRPKIYSLDYHGDDTDITVLSHQIDEMLRSLFDDLAAVAASSGSTSASAAALDALSTTGLVTRTGTNTYTTRTITAGSNIAVTNGSGVSGNPTVAVTGIGSTIEAWDADLDALAALSTTGIVARTGAATYVPRTITAGTGISVSNGDGVAGNPTISSTSTGITSPEVPIVVTVNTKVDTNFGEVIPESLEIAGGVDYEIASGARVEITGAVASSVASAFNNSASSAPSLALTAQKNSAYLYFWSGSGATTGTNAFEGWTAFTFTDAAPASYVKDNRGCWRRINTTTSASSVSAFTATSDFVLLDWEPRLLIHFRMGSDITGQRLWMGLWTNNVADTDTNTRAGVGFRYSTTAGDTGFVMQTGDATNQLLGPSLNTVVASEEYLMSIQLTDGGTFWNGTVERLSDGSVVSGRMAVPSAARGTIIIAAQIRLIYESGTAKSFDLERLSEEFGFLMPAI